MNVLIFGLGLNQGGVGSAKFFSKQEAKVRVTDLKDKDTLKPSLELLKHYPDIEYILGGHKKEDIDWADLIIKNPAVKPENLYIEYARQKGKRVEQDMGIFLDFVKPSKIIGVTGTKGKSTTASLIYEVLSQTQGRKNVVFAGNIGTSVLENIAQITSETLVILEISSFQLESFDQHKVSPKWAVITSITEDHLNYYKTMDEYISAKRIIGRYQTNDDFLFIRKNDPIVDKPKFLKSLKGKIIRFSKKDLPNNFKRHLIGEHNLENLAAALAVTKVLDINDAIASNLLQKFKGIPFRMELIKVWRGIKIYNDTTATNPDAGIRALETIYKLRSHSSSGNIDGGIILIAGGMNKNMSYVEYAKAINKYAKQVFFLEGDSTEEIKKQFQIKKTYSDIELLLKDVKRIVKPGDIILFSPAATSFNLFQNEFDRGRQFNKAVEKIFT